MHHTENGNLYPIGISGDAWGVGGNNLNHLELVHIAWEHGLSHMIP